jgi:hypothetical protein
MSVSGDLILGREVEVVTPLAKKDFVVMGKREEENMGALG